MKRITQMDSNYRYAQRCPECNQFAGENHHCPMMSGGGTPNAMGVKVTEDSDHAVVDGRFKDRVVTLDQLLEMAQIDMSKWYVERHVINKWEVGARNDEGVIVVEPLIQVKAWLKPTEPLNDVLIAIQEAKNDLWLSGKDMVHPRQSYDVTFTGDPVMLEVALYDMHFGMYAWGAETLDADYDIRIARELYMSACAKLIYRSAMNNVEEILFPIGNDGLHADGHVHGSKAGGATAAGTIMDMDTRFGKVFREKKQAVIEAIDMLLDVAPVNVVVVGGNHDPKSSFMLGEIVDAFYCNNQHVTVDNSPAFRKYYKYHTNLIGLAHGKDEKPDRLPIVMATEQPQAWAECTHREWHLGHRHRKSTEMDTDGVVLRWLPSLAPNDAWHASRTYIHNRMAEALVYGREEGWIGSHVVKVRK